MRILAWAKDVVNVSTDHAHIVAAQRQSDFVRCSLGGRVDGGAGCEDVLKTRSDKDQPPTLGVQEAPHQADGVGKGLQVLVPMMEIVPWSRVPGCMYHRTGCDPFELRDNRLAIAELDGDGCGTNGEHPEPVRRDIVAHPSVDFVSPLDGLCNYMGADETTCPGDHDTHQ